LTNENSLMEFLKGFQPQFIIHCAAERHPEICEIKKEFTHNINVKSTEYLANFCQNAPNKPWMLYISTDYVFDGTKAPYQPQDQPNPLNYYGLTKLQGEEIIRKNDVGGILRVPILYADQDNWNDSGVTSLIPLLLSTSTKIEVDDWQIRYPTHVKEVADVIFKLLQTKLKDPQFNGIWHWSGREKMTKYEMIRTIAEIIKITPDHIIPSKQSHESKPYNAQLDISDTRKILGDVPSISFSDSISLLLREYLITLEMVEKSFDI